MNSDTQHYLGEIIPSELPALFTPRAVESHKGSFGTLGIIGGASGMEGALLLAARSALKIGTGKVIAAFAQKKAPLCCDLIHPELMLDDAHRLLQKDLGISAYVVGCGMGTSFEAGEMLEQLFAKRSPTPLVLDADGLNMIASGMVKPHWGDAPIVLTPHPQEAARLLRMSTAQIQESRVQAVQMLARKFNCWVVLKGAGTLISDPQGYYRRNISGNPGLATPGSGDVLAGIIGGLLAQKLPIAQAIAGAVYLHGAGADLLVRQGIGPIGLTASELADAIRTVRNHHTFGENALFHQCPPQLLSKRVDF